METQPRRRLPGTAAHRLSRPARRRVRGTRSGGVAAFGGCLLALLAPLEAAAGDTALAPPAGEVLLVVAGDITLPNVGDEAHLDRGHLDSLPRERFTTTTPWSESEEGHVFEGVSLDALLRAVGASGARFEAHGIDDYSATFEGVDLERYPVILADTQDGVALTVRRLGPLRIMFPFDDHPELLSQTNVAMSVWQLVRMDVR